MGYEWAFIANWLIFGGLTLAFMDPFDMFGSDDEPDEPETRGELINGTDADEELNGTDGNDTMLGSGGNDRLIGGGGSDIIEGNTGNDTIEGGEGDDFLAGGAGIDVILGGAGNDTISADRLDSDAVWTRGGAETLSGGEGDDVLYFTPDDIVSGGSGADVFHMVLPAQGGPAQMLDFNPAEDQLNLFATFDPENPPVLRIEQDATQQTTMVFLGDRQVLMLTGSFTAEQLAIRLLPEDQLTF